MKAFVRVDKLLVDGEYWPIANEQEVVDKNPDDMENIGEKPGEKRSSSNKRKDRSSLQGEKIKRYLLFPSM